MAMFSLHNQTRFVSQSDQHLLYLQTISDYKAHPSQRVVHNFLSSLSSVLVLARMERLPHCVLLRILTAVPLRCALRLRLVCKVWNALLCSPHFLQTVALQPHSDRLHSCFVMAPPPLSAPSPFLLYISGIWLRTHFILPSSSSSIPMTSTAHGNLIAMFTPPVIRVFNLRTSSHCDIPSPSPHDVSSPQTTSMSNLPWSNLFIFCDNKDESYHLVLTEQSPAHHTLFIYSSKSETWRSVSAPFQCCTTWNPAKAKINADKEAAEFFWNPTVGVDEEDLVFWNSAASVLATYCIESDKWKKIRAVSPMFGEDDEEHWMHAGYLAGATVFECEGGRVVLVCAVVIDELLSKSSQLKYRVIKGFRVWDLQMAAGGTQQWRHVASAPHTFWEAYYCVENAEPEFRPKFIHDGACICMTNAKHSGSQQKLSAFSCNKLGRHKPPLLYDLGLNSWSYLPRHSEEADDLVGLFTFKTSLSHLALHNSTSMVYG